LKVLIIAETGKAADIDRGVLAEFGEVTYKQPDTKLAEGVRIIECGTEPDWAWPDFTVVYGLCNIGRHHANVIIPTSADINSELPGIIRDQAEAIVEEEEGTEVS
jgi:hypothetical protein